MMADSEEWRKKGNDEFKKENYVEAASFYGKAIDIDPESHLAHSNRSLTYSRLQKFDLALQDANICIRINSKWAKGYLRKAVALNFLKKHEEAQAVAVTGFENSDVGGVSSDLVKEWMTAGKALMAIKHSEAMEKLAEVIPEYAEMFCDVYCEVMFTVVLHRLSDADSMSHDQMVEAIDRTVNVAKDVMKTFGQPLPVAFEEYAKAASVQIDWFPSLERVQMKKAFEDKAVQLVKWLDEDLHPSLLQIIKPVILLLLSAILVRGNSLTQMYTGHNMTEYLGVGCAALFTGKTFSDAIYSALNLAVLNILLSTYRTKGEVPSDEEIEVIRITCHKMDVLLQKLSPKYPNYDLIKSHYQQSVKVAREICAKVVSGFSKSHDSLSALSELEQAYLETSSNPSKAMDVAMKYVQDIAQNMSSSESGNISHVNFIDAENMLYLTSIFVRLQEFDPAQKLFEKGENMLLSLLATVVVKKTLSLEELPASVTNGRQFVLSGALALREVAPTIAADAIIRWKSFFTELRAFLVQLGLGDAYKEAFRSMEECAKPQENVSKMEVLGNFKRKEGKLLESVIVPIVNALYHQNATAVSNALDENDIVLDYLFFVYNPEYHNPPKNQACGLAIVPSGEPILFMLDNDKVQELTVQLPKAVYSSWYSRDSMLSHPVLCALSELLFPPVVRNVLFKSGRRRVFISPGVDLLCFPIDLLPLTNDQGITKPLFEHFSVSLLSSPRELLRNETINSLKKQLDVIPVDKHEPAPSDDLVEKVQSLSFRDEEVQHDCFVVANPNYEHELAQKLEPMVTSSIKWLFTTLDGFFGGSDVDKDNMPPLPNSEKEAENVCTLLSMADRLKIHLPITGSEATISKLLNMEAPYVLHIATHGYCGKQVNKAYRGNFWTDTSSGILLAGAKAFQENRYEVMDPKMGTGYMNAVAALGMQLRGTQLTFISACNSSVGARPTQEMPDSFTQALRAAGSNTVISTLWTINDGEAVEFVSYFYDHLITRPSCRPSEALSYAKVMMREAGKSMFYWGAFVCHGIDDPLFTV